MNEFLAILYIVQMVVVGLLLLAYTIDMILGDKDWQQIIALDMAMWLAGLAGTTNHRIDKLEKQVKELRVGVSMSGPDKAAE